MALNNQPTNLNYLNPVAFETNILRIPNVSYFCQRITVPGLSMSNVFQPNPYAPIPIEGDQIAFEDLTISFVVDEDLTNYLEIYNWMVSIGYPESHAQYNQDTPEKSDCNIIILTNKSNPSFSITFKDIFPTILGSLPFDTNATSIDPIVCDATFKYTGAFTVKKLT
tara:strand:- start:151 stop:651 length:501 start_codon:yes stop_codon:yes gene_type:complete